VPDLGLYINMAATWPTPLLQLATIFTPVLDRIPILRRVSLGFYGYVIVSLGIIVQDVLPLPEAAHCAIVLVIASCSACLTCLTQGSLWPIASVFPTPQILGALEVGAACAGLIVSIINILCFGIATAAQGDQDPVYLLRVQSNMYFGALLVFAIVCIGCWRYLRTRNATFEYYWREHDHGPAAAEPPPATPAPSAESPIGMAAKEMWRSAGTVVLAAGRLTRVSGEDLSRHRASKAEQLSQVLRRRSSALCDGALSTTREGAEGIVEALSHEVSAIRARSQEAARELSAMAQSKCAGAAGVLDIAYRIRVDAVIIFITCFTKLLLWPVAVGSLALPVWDGGSDESASMRLTGGFDNIDPSWWFLLVNLANGAGEFVGKVLAAFYLPSLCHRPPLTEGRALVLALLRIGVYLPLLVVSIEPWLIKSSAAVLAILFLAAVLYGIIVWNAVANAPGSAKLHDDERGLAAAVMVTTMFLGFASGATAAIGVTHGFGLLL